MARVDAAAQHLEMSRSAFFTIAARRWLDTLDGGSVTNRINQAVDAVPGDQAFTDAAAAALFLIEQPAAEIDEIYVLGYTETPVDMPDAWGDLSTFRQAADQT